jgi:hypothetical protein
MEEKNEKKRVRGAEFRSVWYHLLDKCYLRRFGFDNVDCRFILHSTGGKKKPHLQ